MLPRFGLNPIRDEDGAPAPGPVRMRLALQELGGAWVKLGQMLAMRFDLLPAAYCDEMFKLLNQVRPFPYAQVRAIVQRELGSPPETLFAEFETTSFAAASIGQVHRAVLHSGEPVAVKVQRPGIRESLQADISLMYAFSGWFDRFHLFGATRTRTVIDEFARWTADELDYLVEARQAVVLYDHARGAKIEKVALVHREYTTSRVLTTELIEGIPLIEIIRAKREGNASYLQSLADHGYSLERIARHLDWNMLNEVYVFGYFHADLHPANLFVLPGDAIGYVDFGIVGQLPNDVRESLTRYGWLLFRGELEEAIAELMRWLSPTSSTDAEDAQRQLIRAHEAFIYEMQGLASRPAGSHPADNPYSKLAIAIMKTIRSKSLNLSPSIVPYLKMLVTLGTLRHELATGYDLAGQVRRFFTRQMRQQAVSWLDPRLAMSRVYAGTVRARRAVEFLEFLEGQQATILTATDTLFGFQRGIATARRRLIRLGIGALLVGGLLYVVLAYRRQTEEVLPPGMPYDGVQYGLLVLLVVIIVVAIVQLRRLSQPRSM
jgi:predicted unusual protein kinase regulating ubiquinone biosynthesis (AarF/ABC1/UbiB family)